MGAVLAKFRKEKTTTEVLEDLEERIQEIEKYSLNTQEQKNRFVGNFVAISIGIYVIAFIIFCFVYFPPTWRERLIYSIPLLLFPLVIIFLRRLFTWYFQRKLNKNSNKLSALRTEKKKILEQVMDKETYKVAVNLLARFGDKTSVAKHAFAGMTPRTTTNTQPVPALALRPTSTDTNNQAIANLPSSLRSLNMPAQTTPRTVTKLPQLVAGESQVARQLNFSPQMRPSANQELRRRTPFPVVDQQGKGVFERILDVLIGDGPQDRFAMICKECHAHNGMALKEDFEYTTFRCAFCNALNHSRKSRPVAPRLSLQQPSGTPTLPSIDLDDSSENTLSTTDDESDKELTVRRQVPSIELTESSPIASPESNAIAATVSGTNPFDEEGNGEKSTGEEDGVETGSHDGVADDVRPKFHDQFKKEM